MASRKLKPGTRTLLHSAKFYGKALGERGGPVRIQKAAEHRKLKKQVGAKQFRERIIKNTEYFKKQRAQRSKPRRAF
jgi:hypothetical protein